MSRRSLISQQKTTMNPLSREEEEEEEEKLLMACLCEIDEGRRGEGGGWPWLIINLTMACWLLTNQPTNELAFANTTFNSTLVIMFLLGLVKKTFFSFCREGYPRQHHSCLFVTS